MNAWGKFEYLRVLNPKLRTVGLEALGLDEAMILWSGLTNQDGYISTRDIEAVLAAFGTPLERGLELVEKLLTVGRWEPAVGGYLLHDWLAFHQTATKREETSQARARAGARGGASTASKVSSNGSQAVAPGFASPPSSDPSAWPKPPANAQAAANVVANDNAEAELELDKEKTLSPFSDSRAHPQADQTASGSPSRTEPPPAPPGVPLVGRGLDSVLGGMDPDAGH